MGGNLKMRMYDYSKQFVELEQLLEHGQLDEQTYQDTLKSFSDEAQDKAENLGKMIDNFKAQDQMLKDEVDKLNKKRKTLQGSIDWLTSSLETYLKALGTDEHHAGMYKLWYKKLPDVVQILDENNISEAYRTPQPDKIDKTGIKKALKDGEEVEGVTMETNRRKFEVKK